MLLVLVIISIEHNTNVLDRQVNYDTSENILILTAQVNVNQENRCLHFMSNLWSIVRIRLMGNSKPFRAGSITSRRSRYYCLKSRRQINITECYICRRLNKCICKMSGLFSFRLFAHFSQKVAIRRSLLQGKVLD